MRPRSRRSNPFSPATTRRLAAGAVLLATGGLIATFVSSGGKGEASAATSLADYVRIQQVAPNVTTPPTRRGGSTGVFTVDCGTNGNGKFSPDNPVAQPGIKDGAEHLHDFVGNQAITADTSDQQLAASATTCRDGDRSAYFWPVVRIDRTVRPDAGTWAATLRTVRPELSCPDVRDRIPATPARGAAEVRRQLETIERLSADADRRIQAHGRGVDVRFNDVVLASLRSQRWAALNRIARALSRSAGLVSLADCEMSYDSLHAGHAGHAGPPTSPVLPASSGPSASPSESASSAAPGSTASSTAPASVGPTDPSGPDLELPGNTGGIVQPASVLIEYRGNATSKVVPMPKFLRALTGDAKPTSRGPANARATWTCSGFADRLSAKYPICPRNSQVMRVEDFPGCWDGKNIDSADHRSHLAFADVETGACPAAFQAIPQLRITISYRLPADVQENGQYALDSFPEENHNPFSDHNDFINVNSTRQMAKIAACINTGRRCS